MHICNVRHTLKPRIVEEFSDGAVVYQHTIRGIVPVYGIEERETYIPNPVVRHEEVVELHDSVHYADCPICGGRPIWLQDQDLMDRHNTAVTMTGFVECRECSIRHYESLDVSKQNAKVNDEVAALKKRAKEIEKEAQTIACKGFGIKAKTKHLTADQTHFVEELQFSPLAAEYRAIMKAIWETPRVWVQKPQVVWSDKTEVENPLPISEYSPTFYGMIRCDIGFWENQKSGKIAY